MHAWFGIYFALGVDQHKSHANPHSYKAQRDIQPVRILPDTHPEGLEAGIPQETLIYEMGGWRESKICLRARDSQGPLPLWI